MPAAPRSRVGAVARRALKVAAGEQSETEIQIAVVHHLRTHGYAGRFFHCPNEGARSKAYAATLARMGLLAGVLDLVFLALDKNGRPAMLELKKPGGVLTPAEHAVMGQAAEDGWTVGCAWGVEDALETLRTWGYQV